MAKKSKIFDFFRSFGRFFGKRSHPSNPSNWLLYGLEGGHDTYTGKTISEDEALSSTAVFAALKIISETIASLPLHMYKRLDRGKKRYDIDLRYQMMHIKPNPEMCSMNFREAQCKQILMWGDCYAEKELDESGRAVYLWPLLSKNMEVKRFEGELFYIYRLPEGETKYLRRRNVLHVPGFGGTGLMGINPILQCKQAIGLSLALEEYGARFFGNSAKPPAVLEHPGELSSKSHARLKKAWNESNQGLSNAHRLAILEEGMKLHEYGVSPEDAQALEVRKFQIDEVARIFNMPPHMLKNLDRSTYSNIETQSLEFVTYTLRPWLVRFEQNYSTQLLTDKELRKYFFEYLVDGLLRGDTETRHKAYTHGRQWGYYSANDVREMENLNAIENGDIYLSPMNMVPVDQLQDIEPKPSMPKENKAFSGHEERKSFPEKQIINSLVLTQNRYKMLIRKATQGIIDKETEAVKYIAKKHLLLRGKPSFMRRIEEYYAELPKHIKEKMAPVFRSFMQTIHDRSKEITVEDIDTEDKIEDFFRQYLDRYIDRHIGSSIGQITKLSREVDQPYLYDAINTRMDAWQEKRADKITANEIVRIAGAVSTAVWGWVGVKKLKWVARGSKTCPFCQQMNGKIVGAEGYFLDGSEALVGTDGSKLVVTSPKKHPPIHRGCTCVVVPTK